MWWNKHKGKLLILAAILLAALVIILWPEPGIPGEAVVSPSAEASITVTATPTVSPGSSSPSASPSAETSALASPTPSAVAAPTPSPTAAPTAVPDEDAALSCTMSISCAALLDHLDELDEAKRDLVPADGWLLSPAQWDFEAGESAFDLLRRSCRDSGIHLEFSSTPLYPSAYVEGIGNLYQFDCGTMSGWTYTVNGQSFNFSSSDYALEPGDVVEWVYVI